MGCFNFKRYGPYRPLVINQRPYDPFLDDGKSEWRFVGGEFLGDRIRFDFLDIYAEGAVSSITSIPIYPDDY